MRHRLMLMLLLVLLLGVSSAWAAEPTLARTGPWTLTFYLEPNHTIAATQCVTFTKTSDQVGEANSGTWSSSSFAGWSGEWYQEGDKFHFYGFTSSGLATHEEGSLISSARGFGEFDHYVPGATSSAGGFALVKVSTCPVAAVRAGGDPSK